MRSLLILSLFASVAAADVTTFDGEVAPSFRGQAGARYDGYDVLTSASITANTPDLGGSFLGSTLVQLDPSALITSTQNLYNFAGPSMFELSLGNTESVLELTLQVQLTGTGIDPASVFLEYLDGTGSLVQIFPTSNSNLNAADPGEVQYSWSAGAFAGLEATGATVRFDALGPHMSLDVLVVDALLNVEMMTADLASISLSAGGVQSIDLELGTDFAGFTHWIVGSASGTTPGTDLGGVLLPLNYDSFTTFTLTHPNTALLQGTLGPVDANGMADAAIALPAGVAPSLAGLTLDFACVVLDPVTFGIELATNSTSLTLLP